MGCFKTLTLQPIQDDMPLDQAVYSASRDIIYGVRGGYVYSFNSTTGSLIASNRYQAPAFSDASIAYDPVNDKLFCSVWCDRAFQNNGDTNYDIIVSRKLYRILPATLAVETSAEINGEVGFPGYIGASYQSAILGPHRLIYDNGVLLCTTADNSFGSKIAEINVATMAVAVRGEGLGWDHGQWMDFCVQPAGSEPIQIWLVDPYYEVTPLASPAWTYGTSNYYAYDATDYAAPYNIIYGVCWCPSNGKVYGTCRKQIVVTWAPNTVGSPFALTNINTGDANATPYRIAYNAYDGLIYVPGYKSNNVVVINPATDTVVSTQTGYDSPFDMVFTPTKKWAVQLGSVPLRVVA